MLREIQTALEPDRPRSLLRVLVIAVSALVAAGHPACTQPADLDAKLQFDIPSQPLGAALTAYSAATRLSLFYESTLTDGLRSPSLHGVFTPQSALHRMLEGTGLATTSFEPGTVTILPQPSHAARGQLAAIKSKAAEFTPYLALIQERLRAAFCWSPTTQVDSSELIVRLWIAPSGAVARAELLPTRSGGRDRAYAAALRSLVIGEPPPPGMPQPVTLMVLPRESQAAAECAQAGASRAD